MQLIIDTHHNQKLHGIVYSLLEEAGKSNPYVKVNRYRFIYADGGSNLRHSDVTTDWPEYPDLVKIDAATEMGKLIELLETPKIKIGGYTAEFKNGGVQVGCVFVSKETVKKVYDAIK